MNLKVELVEATLKYDDIESHFDELKRVSENITTDWQNAELKSRELDIELKDTKILHKIEIRKLKEAFEAEKEQLLKEK